MRLGPEKEESLDEVALAQTCRLIYLFSTLDSASLGSERIHRASLTYVEIVVFYEHNLESIGAEGALLSLLSPDSWCL